MTDTERLADLERRVREVLKTLRASSRLPAYDQECQASNETAAYAVMLLEAALSAPTAAGGDAGAETKRKPPTPGYLVHNHGPHEGPGVRCPERVMPDGSLRGACMDDDAERANETAGA